jgi:hypothetical protein
MDDRVIRIRTEARWYHLGSCDSDLLTKAEHSRRTATATRKVLTRRCVGCGWVHAFIVVDDDTSADVQICPPCGRQMPSVATSHDIKILGLVRPMGALGTSEAEAIQNLAEAVFGDLGEPPGELP